MIWSTLLFPFTSDPFPLALWNYAYWTTVYPSSSICHSPPPPVSFLVAELPPNQVYSCCLPIKKGRLYLFPASMFFMCHCAWVFTRGSSLQSQCHRSHLTTNTALHVILWVLYLSVFPAPGEQHSEVAVLRSYLTSPVFLHLIHLPSLACFFQDLGSLA